MHRFLFLFGVFLGITAKSRLPNWLDVCPRNDPEVAACFRDAVDQFKPHFKEGIPEMGIPPMDPLIIPQMDLELGNNFRATFTDCHVYNANEFILSDNIHNFPDNHFEFNLRFPRFNVESKYNVDGKILFLSLKGQGSASMKGSNVTVSVVLDGSRYMKNGMEFIRWDKRKLNFNLGDLTLNIDNPFREDKEFTRQLNKIINENVFIFLEELKPLLEKTIADFVFGITDRIFERFSLDQLHPL